MALDILRSDVEPCHNGTSSTITITRGEVKFIELSLLILVGLCFQYDYKGMGLQNFGNDFD